jgi:hypothetical protein
MTKSKYKILDMINDGDIKQALSSIKANNIEFTPVELATCIDNIIMDNEEGDIDVTDRVELLSHFNTKGWSGAKKAEIERHLRVVNLHLDIEKNNDNLLVKINGKKSVVNTGSFMNSGTTEIFNLDDFNKKSTLSKPESLFNSLFQSNIDMDISEMLKVFDFNSEGMNHIVTQFLSGENDIQTTEGQDCTQKQICSKRKEKTLKAIVSVYGEKLEALEKDYADYLLVELMDALFLQDDLSASDIDLVKKLFRSEFFKGIAKNHRALAKLIANNMHIKYEIRALWHKDKKEAAADLLEKIKAIHDAIDSVENVIQKADSSFEKSDASQLSTATSFGTKVSGIATGAFNFAEAAAAIKKAGSDREEAYYPIVSQIKKMLDQDEHAVEVHNKYLENLMKEVFDVNTDDNMPKRAQQLQSLSNNKDIVKNKLANFLAYFQEEQKVLLDKMCIAYTNTKNVQKHIMFDNADSFPSFKSVDRCLSNEVTVQSIFRKEGQDNSVGEKTIPKHEAASTALVYICFDQPVLIGEDNDCVAKVLPLEE